MPRSVLKRASFGVEPCAATVGELAEHLGVTKQAAAQMVTELEREWYVTRTARPLDSRARVVALTPRGRACTRAAEESAAATLRPWLDGLGVRRSSAMARDLRTRRRLRPTWQPAETSAAAEATPY